MRSQKDAHFSDLCDRVARGKLTNEDERFLISRVQMNTAENDNENFKTGKILITVKPKKGFGQSTKASPVITKSTRIFL